jgi:adenylate cyclase class 2
VDNVKIHLDRVEGLGSFLEIEAIDADGSRTEAELLAQCEAFMAAFGVADADLEKQSYSDLLLNG